MVWVHVPPVAHFLISLLIIPLPNSVYKCTMLKVCSSCHQEKSLECFAKRSKSNDGRRGTCKECVHNRYIRWKENNPEKVREKWRKASLSYYSKNASQRNLKQRIGRVGIAEEEYWKLYSNQDGKCKICNTLENDSPKGRLHIDHCHTTGKVRGLLCSRCNTAIGLLFEDPCILENAKQYLVNH